MSQHGNDGTWKVICPVCGFYKYSDQLRQRWDGVMVCAQDWEPRHPQELYRARAEDSTLPFAWPDATNPELDTSAWVGLGSTDNRGFGDAEQIGGGEDEEGYFGASYFGGSYFGASYF